MKKGLIIGGITLFSMMLFVQCVIEEPPYTVKVVYKNETNEDVDFHAYFSYEFPEFDDLQNPFKTKILSGEQYTQETIVDPLGFSITPFIGADSILFIFHDSLELKFDFYETSGLQNPTDKGEYKSETNGSGKNRVITRTFFITQEHLDSAKVIRK